MKAWREVENQHVVILMIHHLYYAVHVDINEGHQLRNAVKIVSLNQKILRSMWGAVCEVERSPVSELIATLPRLVCLSVGTPILAVRNPPDNTMLGFVLGRRAFIDR